MASSASPSSNNVEITLSAIKSALTPLGAALNFIPVTGVDKIVPAILVLVDRVQRTETNSQDAQGLANEIEALVAMINQTMEGVRKETESIESDLSDDVKSRLEQKKAKKSELSYGGINKLIADLERIPEKAKANQRRNFFWRFLCIDMLESELHYIKDHVKRARKAFLVNQITFISFTVDHTRKMVGEILRQNQEQKILGSLAHAEASYRALDRGDYLEGTRVDLLKHLQEWAESKDLSSERIFVLSGAAGTGKSTVARELARRLDGNKCLGASFFFVGGKAGDSGCAEQLIPTIAYQLATSCSDIRPHIAEAIQRYTPTQNLKSQWDELIRKPLWQISARDSPIIIVLDALDECSRSGILQLFALQESFDELKIPFPFRVFVTARREMRILNAIQRCRASIRCLDMEQIQSVVDIKSFLSAEISKMDFASDLLEKRPHVINELTDKAKGLFIYARTVINILNVDHLEIAVEKLDSILASTGKATGLDSLDTLYLTALQNIYSKEAMTNSGVRARVRAILASLVLLQDQVTIPVVTALFPHVSINSAKCTVKDLRSLLRVSFQVGGRRGASDVESPAEPSFPFDDQNLEECKISALHPTLCEFLADRSRCGNMDFFIDTRVHHADLATNCFRILNSTLRRNPCNLPDPTVMKEEIENYQKLVEDNIPAHVQYAYKFWATHLVEGNSSDELVGLFAIFCKEKLLIWFEALSALNRLDMALSALHKLIPWYQKQSSIDAEVLEILNAGYRLMMKYYTPINCCPEQIYRSALPFAPSSRLLQQYMDHCQHSDSSQCAVRMVTPREQQHQWDGCLRVIEGHEYGVLYVSSVKYSTDGQQIVSGGIGGGVRIWDAITGAAWKTLNYTHCINAVDFHPLDPRVAFASGDGTIHEWDFESSDACTPRPVPEPAGEEGSPVVFQHLEYSDKGSRLAATSNSNLIHVWNAGQGTEPLVIDARLQLSKGGEDLSVSFSKSGQHIGSGSSEGHIWDAISDTQSQLNRRGEGLCSVSFLKGGQHIGSGSSDGHVYIWDAESGHLLNRLKGEYRPAPIYCTKSFPDGLRIVSGDLFGTVFIWDVPANYDPQAVQRPSRVLKSYDREHGSIAITIDVTHTGDLIASGSFGGVIRLWDARSGEALSAYRGHSSSITSVSFSPKEDRLASGSSDGTIRVWDLGIRIPPGNSRVPSSVPVYILCIQFSPTGAYVATGSQDARVIIWDAANGLPIHNCYHEIDRFCGPLWAPGVSALAFSADGAYLASGRFRGIVIWKVANGKEDKVLRCQDEFGNDNSISAIAYSPNGKRIIAAVSPLGLAMLWSVEEGILECSLDLSPCGIFQCQITEIRFSQPENSEPKDSHLVFCRTLSRRPPFQGTDSYYVLNLTSEEVFLISKERFEDGRDSDPRIVEHDNGWIKFTDSSKRLCWLPAILRPDQKWNEHCVVSHKSQHSGMLMVAIGSDKGQLTLLEIAGVSD